MKRYMNMSSHENKDLHRKNDRAMNDTEQKDTHFTHCLTETEKTEEENIKKRKRTIFSRWKRIHK